MLDWLAAAEPSGRLQGQAGEAGRFGVGGSGWELAADFEPISGKRCVVNASNIMSVSCRLARLSCPEAMQTPQRFATARMPLPRV